MIQIGQKIDDCIDDFEFEVYQNDEIKKTKLSNYEGKWPVLLFYAADFTFICPTELEEAAEYYSVRAGDLYHRSRRVLKVMDIHDNSIGRSAEEILRKLQVASFVRQHQGEVCPASWKPGKKTLKPGLELVGKI